MLTDLICFAAPPVTYSFLLGAPILLLLLLSLLSLLLQAQGQGGGDSSICEISEVIVTKVAEHCLLQSPLA